MEISMAASQTDAIGLLKADHRKVENLFAKVRTQFEVGGLPSPETRTFSGHDLEKGAPVDGAAPE
jgi:hypothetical protein